MTSLAFLDLSFNDLSVAQSFENLLYMIPSSVSKLSLAGSLNEKINFSPIHLNFSTQSKIQHLDLSENDIEGRFPPALTNMSSLISLDLSMNALNSSIPFMPSLLKLYISMNEFRQIENVGIWRQCHLKELLVSRNKLEGEMIGPSTNVSKCSQNALEILHLDNNRITGSIPESLGRLTSLRVLDLSYNELTGPIPKALGKLSSLQLLCLSHNQLNSSIPESMGGLTGLTDLLLKSNWFTGPVPVSLGRLTSLSVLSMSSNLLNGTIPSSIGQLTKLYISDISNNSLQGVVSEKHFANLSMLRYLDANSNDKLFFNISREWMPPFQLEVALLDSCKIQDEFPQWLRSQRKLKVLLLSNASIYGPLPTWLRLLPIISILDLSHNKLTGPLTNLPSHISRPFTTSGGSLVLQDNLFTGLIPRRLCKRGDLEILDLCRNRLTRKIPTCLWNTSLKVMLLSSNRLSGVIPSNLGGNPSLLWLQLNDNDLNGELPRDLGYFSMLSLLDLGENKISGNIPEWVGEKITRLVVFRLHKNNFTGEIPHSLCESKLLRILDLANNNLIGSIPHCFGELENMKDNRHYFILDTLPRIRFGNRYGDIMQVLKGAELDYKHTLRFVKNMDLSSNKLVGEIPETLTALKQLIGLNLSNNHFSGGIPKTIGKMKSLTSLDLSANELTGSIPPSLGALNFLSYLNLSRNNLSGQIPTGNQLQTLVDPSIYAINPYLCGAPLPIECSPHKKPPPTTSKNKGGHANKPKKVWFYLDITCGFATGFWGIIGVLMLKKQWRHKLFIFSEEIKDKIYVAAAVRILKMKRGREAT